MKISKSKLKEWLRLWGELIFIFFCLFIVVATDAKADGYFYGELQQGSQFHGNWVGDNPTFVRFGYHHDINKNVYIRGGVEHGSNLDRGDNWMWYADDRDETYINQAYILVGYKFNFSGK